MTSFQRWLLIGFIGVIVVVALVVVSRTGLLLKTALQTGAVQEETPVEVVDSELDGLPAVDAAVDDQARLVAYCEDIKQGHIINCGMHAAPEEDFACRTTHADHAYQECLTTTPVDIVPLTDEEVAILETGQSIEGEETSTTSVSGSDDPTSSDFTY